MRRSADWALLARVLHVTSCPPRPNPTPGNPSMPSQPARERLCDIFNNPCNRETLEKGQRNKLRRPPTPACGNLCGGGGEPVAYHRLRQGMYTPRHPGTPLYPAFRILCARIAPAARACHGMSQPISAKVGKASWLPILLTLIAAALLAKFTALRKLRCWE